jgi:hypothetical protein
MIRSFKDPNLLLTCPTCGREDLRQILPDTEDWEESFGDYPNNFVKHNYLMDYKEPAENEEQFICNHCCNYYNGEYNDTHPIGAVGKTQEFPLSNPHIDKICHYPQRCFCGQCPDPNQLQFDIKWYEKGNK